MTATEIVLSSLLRPSSCHLPRRGLGVRRQVTEQSLCSMESTEIHIYFIIVFVQTCKLSRICRYNLDINRGYSLNIQTKVLTKQLGSLVSAGCNYSILILENGLAVQGWVPALFRFTCFATLACFSVC